MEFCLWGHQSFLALTKNGRRSEVLEQTSVSDVSVLTAVDGHNLTKVLKLLELRLPKTTHCDQYHQPRQTMASDYDKPMIAGERDIFETYFDDPKFSDLTLKLSDRTVHVHRVVLCRGSEYFKSLLAGSFQVSSDYYAGSETRANR